MAKVQAQLNCWVTSKIRPMAKRDPKPQKPSKAQPQKQAPQPAKSRPASAKRPTLVPTLTLLLVMTVVGLLTAIIGYLFGQNALKGTTQPVVNPILGVGGTGVNTTSGNSQEPTFLRESDVVAEVKAQTSGLTQPSPSPTETNSPSPSPTGSPASNPTASPTPSPGSTTQAKLPLTSEVSGVSLTVASSQRQSGDLILNVSLQNKSKRTLQFIYTFLEVTDDKGRALTAVTNGLPTELKPESTQVSGTITIPAVTLEGAKSVSISLADYPNQEVVLAASNIPVN